MVNHKNGSKKVQSAQFSHRLTIPAALKLRLPDSLRVVRMALWLSLILMLGVGSGCARTVETQSGILEMHVHMEFMGPVDVSQYRYLMIFSPSAAPVLPSIPPSIYFPTPGRTYDEITASQNGGITSYYQNYFKTWSDYILIGSSTLLYPSNANSFLDTTTNNASYQISTGFSATTVISGNTIDCRFFVQALSPSNPNRLYFKFATSRLNDGTQSGYLQDFNDDDEAASILLKSGQKVGPFTHAPPGSPPLGAALSSWYVEVL